MAEDNRGRLCYYIPEDAFEAGRGFRVAIVNESEPGYAFTGGDGKTPWNGEGMAPWYWGKTLDEAREVCKKANLEKLGLSESAVFQIITRSMAAQNAARRKRNPK